MKFIRELFSELDGKASMKRVNRLLIVLVFLVTYIKVAFASNTFVDIPWGWLILLSAILGFSELVALFKK